MVGQSYLGFWKKDGETNSFGTKTDKERYMLGLDLEHNESYNMLADRYIQFCHFILGNSIS